jgi:hypothetical protein
MPTEKRYWQIGSGQGERDYSRECLDYGIAFVGEKYREDVERIRVGDRIVLRRGTAKIIAVGRATEHKGRVSEFADEENKRWLRDFDGWDLPAFCYVEWHKPATPEEAPGLSQRAISRVNKSELRSGVADAALEQAEGYAKPLPNCNLIVVANGYCYKAFERSEPTSAFSKRPSAYLNIREPRDRYPLDPPKVEGALKVFELLLP